MSNLKDIVSAFDELKEKMTGLEKLLKKGKFRKSASSSEDKPKREAGPWAVWASQCKLLHPSEFAEYKAENEKDDEGNKVKGVHIHFATFWRKEHPDEYDNFAAELKAKRASGTESASTSEAEKPAKKTTAKATKTKKVAESEAESESEDEKPKKKAPVKEKSKVSEKKSTKKSKADSDSESESEDEKPKKKAPAKEEKKAPAKAKKEEKPKVKETEETENVSAELWDHKGKSYFRTSQNDCWSATEDGEMGPWAGRYDPIKDKIDPSAVEPEFEH